MWICSICWQASIFVLYHCLNSLKSTAACRVMAFSLKLFYLCFFRSCAEEALRMLNGTQLGGQNIRLSWGRSPSNKQVLYIIWCIFWFFFVWWPWIQLMLFGFLFVCRLSQTQTSGMLDTMDMPKVMRIMVMRLLLRKTLACTTEDIQDMEIISSPSNHSSRKWILMRSFCLCDCFLL